MSAEISLSVSASGTKNGSTISGGSKSYSVDMSGDPMISNIQAVGTSAETIQLGDITSLGFIHLRNMDATNYVEVAVDNFTNKIAKLKAGECALFRATVNTLYIRANTAACNVHVAAWSD